MGQAVGRNSTGAYAAAQRLLRRALTLVERSGDPTVRALHPRVLTTLAFTTVGLRGRDASLELLEQARAEFESAGSADGVILTRVQEAAIQQLCGDWHASLVAAEAAAPGLGLLTPRQQCTALVNHGMASLGLGDVVGSRRQLQAALDLARAEGFEALEFKALHDLGCVAFVGGDLPLALRLMADADNLVVDVARARAGLDYARVLTEVGLVDRAESVLHEALTAARAEGQRLDEGEILLDLARCALLRDDVLTARTHTVAADRVFATRQAAGRRDDTRLFRAVVELAAGSNRRRPVPTSMAQPDNPRLPQERLAVRVAAEQALRAGDIEGAARLAASLRTRRSDGAAARLHDALVSAMVQDASGRRAAARRTVRRAADLLAGAQSQVNSLEVRSGLALHGRRIAAYDVGVSLRAGSVRDVYASVERWRAVSHRLPPVVPPPDPEVADLLTRLRAERRLELDHPTDARAHVIDRLEREIARASWVAPNSDSPSASRATAVGFATAREVVGRREVAVASFFVHGGDYHVLVITPGAATLRPVGSRHTVDQLVERMAQDIRAIAMTGRNPALSRAVRGSLAGVLAELDALLLAPLAGFGVDGMRRVVVVPTHGLSRIPWSMLPSVRGRPVTVSSSVSRWSREVSPRPDRPRVVALAGPGLDRAVAEADEVAAVWGGARSIPAATSPQALATFASADLVHIAAHGVHEEQNPLFSSVRLTDGPMFAHELHEPLRARHVVLSACDAGRSRIRPGDEPLGLTAALLALGVDCVVSAVAPVLDDVAEPAMRSYHEALASGSDAAQSLAIAVGEVPDAGLFCVFGGDWG